MTDERDDDDDLLSGYFAAARRTAPLPDGDFLQRIAALGQAEAPRVTPQAPVAPAARPAAPGLMAQIGGWWTASGLAGALALGLVMGMSGTVDLTGTGLYGTVEMLPGLDTPFADSDTAGGE